LRWRLGRLLGRLLARAPGSGSQSVRFRSWSRSREEVRSFGERARRETRSRSIPSGYRTEFSVSGDPSYRFLLGFFGFARVVPLRSRIGVARASLLSSAMYRSRE